MSNGATARPCFITIEGGEGAGKSTQAGRLSDRLTAVGIDVLTSREPGGAPGADAIRGLLVEGAPERWDAETEALLHFAARRDHLVRTVWPALAAGRWVVCDRFADSTMAYQGYGHGLGRDFVSELYELVVGDFAPDLTLILDIPVEPGLARAVRRDGREARYEAMSNAFHARLRDGFLDIATREPGRCAIIDASRSPDTVADDVWRTVVARLEIAA